MSENALLRLLPVYAINGRPPARPLRRSSSSPGCGRRALVAQPYLVRPDECPDELRSEWMRFVRHKFRRAARSMRRRRPVPWDVR
ncbi:MAG: hypothetical protein MZV63_36190 [Marinilabiliales bacterium]|nr:hypothetical protein [Marinilabiliales bacterium]